MEYLWRDVLRPEFSQPAWSIEYAPQHLRPLVNAIAVTFIKSLRPWVFWGKLQLHHQPRINRLFTYAAFWIILPALAAVVASLLAAVLLLDTNIVDDLPFVLADIVIGTLGMPIAPTFVWLLFHIVFACTFVLLPITRKRCKVRAVHFVRLAAYGLAPPLAAIAIAAVLSPMWWHLPSPLDDLADGAAMFLVTIAPPLLLLAWWYCGIRWHLRLPHALSVTVVMAVLTLLLSAFIVPALVAVFLFLVF